MGWFTSVTLSEKNGNDYPQDDKGCILSHLLVGGSKGMNTISILILTSAL